MFRGLETINLAASPFPTPDYENTLNPLKLCHTKGLLLYVPPLSRYRLYLETIFRVPLEIS